MSAQTDDLLSAHLFEVAWEVCARVGGIYTVIQSKVPSMLAEWGDRYLLIGPYEASRGQAEFEELEPNGVIGDAIADLRTQGVVCHYGRWLVPGYPRVILLDYAAWSDHLMELKYRVWMDHNISLPPGDALAHNVVLFADLVRRFFEAVARRLPSSISIIGHFHEWMTGLAIPMMRKQGLRVATVFTTHATVIGRAYCFDRDDFYDVLDRLNPDVESGKRNMYHLYCMERAAAASADVFTTISDVTGLEAEKLLARKPDLITPNGLRVQRFEALHEFQNLHRQFKEQIHDFVRGHFFGSYSFDLDRTLYVFLAGRYEFRNKGMDVYIESLARLNWRLKQAGSDVTIVAFLVTRAATWGLNGQVLDSRFAYDELKRSCEELARSMGPRLAHLAAMGQLPKRGDLLSCDAIVDLKRVIQACRRSHLPIIVTHELQDNAFDPVIVNIRRVQLFNAEADRVKIVYHPDFITPTSPLFRMDYEQFVRGCHMGVFPSYYEPWGYTPAECTALGVPSVTSDLSGFGSFVQQHIPDHEEAGLHVIRRRHTPWEDTVQQLTEVLFQFSRLNRRQRIAQRNRVESVSETLAWQNLARYYFEAQRLALTRHRAAVPFPA